MSADLRLLNRQRTRKLSLRHLRKAIQMLLGELLDSSDYDLTVHFVNAPEMARLNEKHLGHEGSTDVITLDYASHAPAKAPATVRSSAFRRSGEPYRDSGHHHQTGATPGSGPSIICGELFVCVDEALIQARHFRVPWTTETMRYIIHGILHLRGHDDLNTSALKRMKREETRLLRELGNRFPLSRLAMKTKLDK